MPCFDSFDDPWAAPHVMRCRSLLVVVSSRWW